MTTFDRINVWMDRTAALEERMGSPWRRTAVIRHVGAQLMPPYLPEYTDYVMDPKPHIESVKPDLVGLTFGSEEQVIQVSALDLLLTTSRTTPKSQFLRDDNLRVIIWVDAELDGAGNPQYEPGLDKRILGGHEYQIIHVFDDCTCWKLLLRRVADRR